VQIANYVYGGSGQPVGGPMPPAGVPILPGGVAVPVAGGYPMPQPAQVQPASEEDDMRDLNRAMMRWGLILYQMKTMTQTLGIGPGGEMIPVLRMTPEGKPVRDEQGSYVFDQVPATRANYQAALRTAEGADPTKLAQGMMDVFIKGTEFAKERAAGGGLDQIVAVQKDLMEARVEAARAGFDAEREIFKLERGDLMKRLEQQSPEKVVDQMKKWKELGLFGGDNMEALKLQAQLKMAEWKRQDERELLMAEAQAKAAESGRQGDTMRKLLELGSQAIERAVSPISQAVAQGIQMRSALMPPGPTPTLGTSAPATAPGPAPGFGPAMQPVMQQPVAPPPPTDYRAFTQEQRAEIRRRIEEARAILDSQEGQLDAAGP
jgi:hypothetical protein